MSESNGVAHLLQGKTCTGEDTSFIMVCGATFHVSTGWTTREAYFDYYKHSSDFTLCPDCSYEEIVPWT